MNKHNKHEFRLILGNQTSVTGKSVHHSDADAGFTIVSNAVALAKYFPVTIIGEDTDLLTLRLHHFKDQLHHLFYLFSNTTKTVLDIKSKLKPKKEVVESTLETHKLCECDTASKSHFRGELIILRQFMKNMEFTMHSCMLVKRFYSFSWVLKKEKSLDDKIMTKYLG